MAESLDICSNSQEEALALEPSRDNVQGLETSQDSNLLEEDEGADHQEGDQDHLDGLAVSGTNLLSPSWLVDNLNRLGSPSPLSEPLLTPRIHMISSKVHVPYHELGG